MIAVMQVLQRDRLSQFWLLFLLLSLLLCIGGRKNEVIFYLIFKIPFYINQSLMRSHAWHTLGSADPGEACNTQSMLGTAHFFIVPSFYVPASATSFYVPARTCMHLHMICITQFGKTRRVMRELDYTFYILGTRCLIFHNISLGTHLMNMLYYTYTFQEPLTPVVTFVSVNCVSSLHLCPFHY